MMKTNKEVSLHKLGALSLKKALEMSRLDEFIAQEEARGIGSASSADLEAFQELRG